MLAEAYDMNRISYFILDVRRKRQWTQKELAKKLGVSQQHVDQLEKGELTYPIKTCKKLHKFLDPKERDLMREALINQLLDELDS